MLLLPESLAAFLLRLFPGSPGAKAAASAEQREGPIHSIWLYSQFPGLTFVTGR